MPTTLSQLGRVAKAQVKGQHQNQQVTPFSEQQEKRDELKLQKVSKTEEAAKGRIDADPDEEEKRKQHRKKRSRRGKTPSDKNLEDQENGSEQAEDQTEAVGLTIDLMA